MTEELYTHWSHFNFTPEQWREAAERFLSLLSNIAAAEDEDAEVNHVEKKRALVDHELCHAAPVLNKQLEPVYNEAGRAVYRSRKHDIEEFRCIVERHGCYKRDLEEFAKALLAKRETPMLPLETKKEKAQPVMQ